MQRGAAKDGWEAQHIDVCLNAFETDISGEKIVVDIKNADEIATEIINLSELYNTQITEGVQKG